MTLSFEVDVPMQYKTLFVSRHIPYTFSNLVHFLLRLERSMFHKVALRQDFSARQHQVTIETNSLVYSRRKIGCSPLGLPLYAITLAGRPLKGVSHPAYHLDRKLKVLVLGRHNGNDSASSFTVQSMIEHLSDSSEYAGQLRSLCEFHFIPMVNADGCVLGNSRGSLNGQHLSSHWAPSSDNHHYAKEVRHIEEYVTEHLNDQVFMVLQIDNHNQAHNVFLKGGSSMDNTWDYTQLLLGRLFAHLLQKENLLVQMG